MSEWTIKKALEWTEGYLADKGDENPRLSAQWLLSEACGLSRTQLFVNFDRLLSEDERGVLRDYVRRRGAGEPLQYITGEVAFRHINVKVRPGVLIPRPETEVLVSEVLAADARPPRCGVEPRGRRAGARGCRRREEGPGGGGGICFPLRRGRPWSPLGCE